MDKYDGGWAEAKKWASEIHDFLTISNVSAWIYFQTQVQAPQYLGDNEGMMDANGNIAKRAYVIGNWSKFVRPGWHRVDVTNNTGLRITAFENTNGTLGTLVVLNASGYPIFNQGFAVGTKLGSRVTPWITSSWNDLRPLAPVTVSEGSFTYTIPANSVITFYSTKAGASLLAPAAASSFAAKVMINDSSKASMWRITFGLIVMIGIVVASIFVFVRFRKSGQPH